PGRIHPRPACQHPCSRRCGGVRLSSDHHQDHGTGQNRRSGAAAPKFRDRFERWTERGETV
ncbi:uncharacterized protein METZ01_LOCUS75421, partial [marine metagenome]